MKASGAGPLAFVTAVMFAIAAGVATTHPIENLFDAHLAVESLSDLDWPKFQTLFLE